MKKKASSYQSVVVESNTFNNKEEKRAYALLPVWMVNIKYKDKIHTFAMNGQTGEFIGNIPLDVNKTILFSVLIFTSLTALIILISYLVSGVWI